MFFKHILRVYGYIINIVYFFGWYAIVDNRPSLLEPTKNGLIKLTVLRGKYNIEVKFVKTPVRKFSDTVSLLSFLILLIILVKAVYLKQV